MVFENGGRYSKYIFFIDQLLFYRKSKLFRSQTTSALQENE